jgi:hypothetical protein
VQLENKMNVLMVMLIIGLLSTGVFAESTPAVSQPDRPGMLLRESTTSKEYDRLLNSGSSQTPQYEVPKTEYRPVAKQTTNNVRSIEANKKKGFTFGQMAETIKNKNTPSSGLSFKNLADRLKDKEDETPTDNSLEKLKKEMIKGRPN